MMRENGWAVTVEKMWEMWKGENVIQEKRDQGLEGKEGNWGLYQDCGDSERRRRKGGFLL